VVTATWAELLASFLGQRRSSLIVSPSKSNGFLELVTVAHQRQQVPTRVRLKRESHRADSAGPTTRCQVWPSDVIPPAFGSQHQRGAPLIDTTPWVSWKGF